MGPCSQVWGGRRLQRRLGRRRAGTGKASQSPLLEGSPPRQSQGPGHCLLRTQSKEGNHRLPLWMGVILPPQEHRDITATCGSPRRRGFQISKWSQLHEGAPHMGVSPHEPGLVWVQSSLGRKEPPCWHRQQGESSWRAGPAPHSLPDRPRAWPSAHGRELAPQHPWQVGGMGGKRANCKFAAGPAAGTRRAWCSSSTLGDQRAACGRSRSGVTEQARVKA